MYSVTHGVSTLVNYSTESEYVKLSFLLLIHRSTILFSLLAVSDSDACPYCDFHPSFTSSVVCTPRSLSCLLYRSFCDYRNILGYIPITLQPQSLWERIKYKNKNVNGIKLKLLVSVWFLDLVHRASLCIQICLCPELKQIANTWSCSYYICYLSSTKARRIVELLGKKLVMIFVAPPNVWRTNNRDASQTLNIPPKKSVTWNCSNKNILVRTINCLFRSFHALELYAIITQKRTQLSHTPIVWLEYTSFAIISVQILKRKLLTGAPIFSDVVNSGASERLAPFTLCEKWPTKRWKWDDVPALVDGRYCDYVWVVVDGIDVPCVVALNTSFVGYWKVMYVDGGSEIDDSGDGWNY